MPLHHRAYSVLTDRPAYMRHLAMRSARFLEDDNGASSAPPAPAAPVPGPPPRPAVPAAPAGTPGDAPNGESGKEASTPEADAAKEWERRAMAAEAKVKAAEDATLSDIDLANQQRDEARNDAQAARSELAAYKLANTHGIKEQDDIDLLLSVAEDKREALATRLAAKPEAEKAPTYRRLDPLPKSGSGSAGGNGPHGSMQAGRDRFAAKHGTK